MSLPKVLILNQPFNTNSGGGVTLTNLFSGWDKDKLAVICSGRLLDTTPKLDLCDEYYQIGEQEHKWLFPFSLIKRKYPSGLVQFDTSASAKPKVGKSKLRVNLIMKVFYPTLEYLGISHLVSKLELSKEICQWLDEYNPDVIYAQANTREDINFCIALAEYLKKPMVFHMMDDWLSTNNKGLFKGYWSRRIDQEFKKLLDKAVAFLSISDFMAEEYKKRYGKNFIPFHNPIDVDFWKKHQKQECDLADPVTVLYAGRTGLGIDSSLEVIAKAIQASNKSSTHPIKLILQTAEKPEWLNKYDCVQHKSFVAYEDLPRVFAQADFLILPYDFSPAAVQFIKYSMPTKASEYMVSGTPIIVFAPEETALVKYAKQHNWAAVVTENQVSRLTAVINELVSEQSQRQKIADNAKELAEKRHTATVVRAAFRDIICAAELN